LGNQLRDITVARVAANKNCQYFKSVVERLDRRIISNSFKQRKMNSFAKNTQSSRASYKKIFSRRKPTFLKYWNLSELFNEGFSIA
jgi:hypothetical protein